MCVRKREEKNERHCLIVDDVQGRKKKKKACVHKKERERGGL